MNKNNGLMICQNPLKVIVRKSDVPGEIKIEVGNWEEQYKSTKTKFPVSIFDVP